MFGPWSGLLSGKSRGSKYSEDLRCTEKLKGTPSTRYSEVLGGTQRTLKPKRPQPSSKSIRET